MFLYSMSYTSSYYISKQLELWNIYLIVDLLNKPMQLFGFKKKLSWFEVFVEINLIFVFAIEMLF